MRIQYITRWIVLLMIACIIPSAAYGATAMQTVRQEVTQTLQILISKTSDADKRAAIRAQVQDYFDFELMSRLALSYHWKQMSKQAQDQFVSSYRRLLEDTYIDKLLRYNNQKVEYGRSTRLSADRVQIQTQIVSNGASTPLEYKMIRRQGKWHVYDLVIENVSMAQNYRSQFNSFLQDKSIAQLLQELQRKVDKRQS